MGEKFLKYLIIMVFALYWAWGVSKKKSQYPADGAEYCDFTFLLYKSFLFDVFFYRLQYLVENLIGVAEGDEIALKLRWTYVDAHRHAVRLQLTRLNLARLELSIP